MKEAFEIEYPAVFEPQEEGGYTVVFPDLNGCVTEGEDLEDAMRNAREALTGYLESLHGRRIQLPVPTNPKRLSGEVHLVAPELNVMIPLALRQARKSAGLSQQDVARIVGTSYQSYQKCEDPRANLGTRTIGKVFRALGVYMKLILAPEESHVKRSSMPIARKGIRKSEQPIRKAPAAQKRSRKH